MRNMSGSYHTFSTLNLHPVFACRSTCWNPTGSIADILGRDCGCHGESRHWSASERWESPEATYSSPRRIRIFVDPQPKKTTSGGRCRIHLRTSELNLGHSKMLSIYIYINCMYISNFESIHFGGFLSSFLAGYLWSHLSWQGQSHHISPCI